MLLHHYTRIRFKIRNGFAIVTTLTLLCFIALISLGLISLVHSERKHTTLWFHQQQAKANARMALTIAIAELQKYAGPDQRMTANASILDTDPSTEVIEGVHNPRLLGVWKNTTQEGFHLIGKDVSSSLKSPTYAATDRYVDLRFSSPLHSNDKWRNDLRLTWLASFVGDKSQAHTLDLTDSKNSITLVGKGTLGEGITRGDPQAYQQELLAAQKIKLESSTHAGSYAWAVIENNQKAAISTATIQHSGPIQFAAAQRDNLTGFSPTSHLTKTTKHTFESLENGLQFRQSPVISYANTTLISDDPRATTHSLSTYYNHFTDDSSGLFTDPIFGGIKKDLTPLLFAKPDQVSIDFPSPSPTTAQFSFTSSYPIIPGSRHLTHGPNFDALRYWGKLKYTKGLSKKSVIADYSVSQKALRKRPTLYWRGEQNDGYTFQSTQWSSHYPKIQPVITDARFHFYFGLTSNSPDNRIRTHLIPRVCLWNPYNVELQSPEMVVLLPNFFWSGGNFHFQLSSSDGKLQGERERLISQFPDERSLLTWDGKLRFHCGSSNPHDSNSPPGLFPQSRYLAFVIEKTTFPAGACLVFSPKVTGSIKAGDISIQEYSTDTISCNILSAEEPQGASHYYHDSQRLPFYQYDSKEKLGSKRTKSVTEHFLDEVRLEEMIHYEPWVVAADHFDFILKAANGPLDVTAKSITNSPQYPTLQLINGGSGGARTYPFYFYNSSFGNSTTASGGQFGKLQSFRENPYKDPPALHQIGSKLLWYNEQFTEANNPPLRQKFWDTPSHVAYNPASIAHWNVRSQLSTRSPASPCNDDWHSRSSGAWMTQLAPHSPHSNYDFPVLNKNYQYAKFPFSAASDSPGTHSSALFDLPNPFYGALSVGALRHAPLSPYSWHPSYVIGSSLPDLHAPLDSTAYPLACTSQRPLGIDNQWDLLVGASHSKAFDYGPRGLFPKSSGLLQIGQQSAPVTLNHHTIDTTEEMLAYDIAYETNQNIWDSYFISGLQLTPSGNAFVENPLDSAHLLNARFEYNATLATSKEKQNRLFTSDIGLNHAFWNAGYYLKNKSAFNVNSTSIPAWSAFLSGLKGLKRPLRESGSAGGPDLSIFSRCSEPYSASESNAASPTTPSGWQSGRALDDADIASLAAAIVEEVKSRGPFISLADMVNRRLIPPGKLGPSPHSRAGMIEAAIQTSGLNESFYPPPWRASTHSKNDNNKQEFRHQYADRSPPSKLWGAPGFLTQSDILAPLAPAMSIRGDTFTIRCYGESLEGSTIKATAYIEAVVFRSADYLESSTQHSLLGRKNRATDPAMKIDFADGSVSKGDLTTMNSKFGRRFKIKSFRWLAASEI